MSVSAVHLLLFLVLDHKMLPNVRLVSNVKKYKFLGDSYSNGVHSAQYMHGIDVAAAQMMQAA